MGLDRKAIKVVWVLDAQRKRSLQSLLTLRIAALITICDLKCLRYLLRLQGLEWECSFFFPLVAKRVIVIIAFYSQAILLSE